MMKKLLLFIALLGITAAPASAETAGITSELTWRPDDTGDYLLSVPAPPGTYRSQDVVPLSTDLSSVTVCWKAQGAAQLELSLDGGKQYIPVVNATPISPVPSGRNLTWRARLGADSILESVTVRYCDQQGICAGFGEPALSGFLYRRAIALSNPQDDLFEYQLLVRVGRNARCDAYDVACEGKTGAGMQDMCFTAADGQTVLPYWVESVEQGVARCWVRVPQIPAGDSVIYLYYGNRAAPTPFSAQEVFDFYDDFDTGAVSGERWEATVRDGGLCGVSSGTAQFKNAQLLSREFNLTEAIIEYKAAVTAQPLQLIVRSDAQAGESNEQTVAASRQSGLSISVGGTVVAVGAQVPAAGFTWFQAHAGSRMITYARCDAAGAPEPDSLVEYALSAGDLSGGRIGFRSPDSGVAMVDWIRVRRYSREPIGIDGMRGAAEAVSPAKFDGITVDRRGDLRIVPEAGDGVYRSAALPLTTDARIVAAEWQADCAQQSRFHLDLSLDRGESFLNDCVARQRYYASRKDFSEGKALVARVRMQPDEQPTDTVQSISVEYHPGVITVTAPNGGETLATGQHYTIRWSADEYGSEYRLRIDYSSTGGAGWLTIAESVPNSGSYSWQVSSQPATAALIRVCDELAPEAAFDVSDRTFAVRGDVPEAADSEPAAMEPEVIATKVLITPDTHPLPEQELKKNESDTAARLYDVVIKVGDTVSRDPEKDKYCYKDGDVIMVRPSGTLWGADELRHFVIVQMELTPQQARELLQPAQAPGSDARLGRRKYRLRPQDAGVKNSGDERFGYSGAVAGFGGRRSQTAKKMQDLSPQERRLLRQKQLDRAAIQEK